MVRKILDERLISIPEVKEILDNVYERLNKLGKEPDMFQQITYEYAHNFTKCSAEQARKITKMLMADYEMELKYAVQIINIDPSYPQELRVILEKDPKLKNLNNEELQIMIQKIKDLQNT